MLYFYPKIINFREGDEMKVYGAGLLSSAAELQYVMSGVEVRNRHT